MLIILNIIKINMKTLIIRFIAFAIVSTSVFSCTTSSSKSAYECPMHCQKDTAYTNEGLCPVCRMDLEKTINIDSTKTTILTNTK